MPRIEYNNKRLNEKERKDLCREARRDLHEDILILKKVSLYSKSPHKFSNFRNKTIAFA